MYIRSLCLHSHLPPAPSGGRAEPLHEASSLRLSSGLLSGVRPLAFLCLNRKCVRSDRPAPIMAVGDLTFRISHFLFRQRNARGLTLSDIHKQIRAKALCVRLLDSWEIMRKHMPQPPIMGGEAWPFII